jgi:MFS family permease
MDVITLVAFIISIYLAGRIAERRGRSFRIWAWIAAIIGPLALPLVVLFPNLHGKNGDLADVSTARSDTRQGR